jgi:choline dehydrogenase
LRLNAHVHRVLFHGDKAIGVELMNGEKIHVQREVLIAASSVGAAKLMLLSGVGPADELRHLGIKVILHQPNTGRNLENHPGVNLQYAARHEDSLVSQLGPLGRAKLGLQWLLTKRGLGASNFFEVGAFLKTHASADYANLQLEFLPLARRVVSGKLKVLPGFQLWMDLSRPKSRGAVRLLSADPHDKPEIIFNHLQDEDDCKNMVRSVKLARDLFAQPAWDGLRGAEMNPTADVRTDSDILDWVRHSVGTSYHPSGTCRMSVLPEEGVVDAVCRVHGLQNLRVVCAAVMPQITTGNLSAPTYMIAEKISDDIRGVKQ